MPVNICVDKKAAILAAVALYFAIGLVNGFYLDRLFRSHPVVFWLADVLQFVVVPGLGALLLARIAGIYPVHYGFRSLRELGSPARVIGLMILVSALFWLFYAPVKTLGAQLIIGGVPQFSYATTLPTEGLSRTLVNIYLSATAGVVEEAVFRALPWLYFIMRFPERPRVWSYALWTSLAFSAVHWEQGPHGVLAAFTLGLMAAFVYARIRNLWPLVFAHFITDLTSFS